MLAHGRAADSSASTLQGLGDRLHILKKALKAERQCVYRAKQMPARIRIAAQILYCRFGDEQQLRVFFFWSTKTVSAQHVGWVKSIVSGTSLMAQDLCESYRRGDSNAAMVRANGVVDKFVAEQSLHSWIHRQNSVIGVSPEPAIVTRQLPLHGIPAKSKAGVVGGRTYKGTLQFLRRWRMRWRVKQGIIKVGEDMEPSELLAKVSR